MEREWNNARELKKKKKMPGKLTGFLENPQRLKIDSIRTPLGKFEKKYFVPLKLPIHHWKLYR